MTIDQTRLAAHGSVGSPELIAVARLASLRARGVVATARPWDSWLFDGISEPSNVRPWLVVTPDDLTIEIVFDQHAYFDATRRVLLRLLADRWDRGRPRPSRHDPQRLPRAGRSTNTHPALGSHVGTAVGRSANDPVTPAP